MNWDPSLSWTRTQTQKIFFFIIFLSFSSFLFFHYIFEENWTFLQWAKSFLRNQTQKQYSNPELSQYILSSQNLSSLMAEIPIMETQSLSLFSHLKPELSLFSHGQAISWLKTHGLSSSLNPWIGLYFGVVYWWIDFGFWHFWFCLLIWLWFRFWYFLVLCFWSDHDLGFVSWLC